MPTREELETELGKAWKAMAKKEGHSPGVPKQFVPSQSDNDALADTLLRLMQKRPGATMRTLAGQLNTTIDDTRTGQDYNSASEAEARVGRPRPSSG